MKHTLSAIILGLIVLFSGAAVNAQSFSKLSAKIDFDFHVAGKKFEAGDYVIERIRLHSDVYHLRRLDEKAQSLFILRPENTFYSGLGSSEYVLRFNRYGNDYFLSTITGKDSSFKAKIPKTKVELQISRQFNHDKTEEVAVLSKSEK